MSGTRVPADLRRAVDAQAQERCGYCLSAASICGQPMEIDHLFPEALDGPTTEGNLWLACTACNRKKCDRVWVPDPASGEVVRLFNPRRQAWRDHFEWSGAGDRIRGLTPVGRATVAALDLNRACLVAARRVWIAAGGAHPPPE